MIYCRTLIFYEFGWFYIYETLSNQSDCLNLSDKDSDWLIVASILEGEGRGGGVRGGWEITSRALLLPACVTTEKSKLKASPFVNRSHDVFYHPSYLLRSACALISTFALPPCYKHSNLLFMSIVGMQTVLRKGVSR